MWNAILAGIRGLFIGLLNNTAIRLLAFKYFIKAVIIVAIPLAILMGINMFMNEVIEWTVTQIGAVNVGDITTYQITGIAFYLVNALGLDTAMGAIISALSIKFTLKCIPFLRV